MKKKNTEKFNEDIFLKSVIFLIVFKFRLLLFQEGLNPERKKWWYIFSMVPVLNKYGQKYRVKALQRLRNDCHEECLLIPP